MRSMRLRHTAVVVGCLIGGILPALAEPACPGNPDAIGTSRTIVVDPAALPLIGSMQYKTTLPLNDHEVAITFDDGPLPPNTGRILDTLAANCVKVTYFLVGEMAHTYPDLVRRIYNEGHVIGTHSQTHPLTFNRMAEPRIESQVNDGIASVEAAVGDPRAVAPFFRIPGLLRNAKVEAYLASKSLAVWSADEVADDWHRGITAKKIVSLAIKRIEAHDHRGVLLLHDIHPATATALPMLLKELKDRGYHIVQAVPAGDRPKSVPERVKPVVADSSGTPSTADAGAAHDKKAAKHMHAKARHRHRKRLAHADRDPEVSAAITKKKRKAQTAATEQDRFTLWR
jgi:peptidoglycan/xylan/chitin deacetylase (PgdA/CDA1 family)